MANRIVIGNLGTSYGLKISKPGFDALVTSDENLLIDTSSNFSRVLQMGVVYFPSGGTATQTASIPSIGSGTPVVVFKAAEVYQGQTYIYPMYRNTTNVNPVMSSSVTGWTVTVSGTTITITKNFTSTYNAYIYYFSLALPI